jgi:hypothetical protein
MQVMSLMILGVGSIELPIDPRPLDAPNAVCLIKVLLAQSVPGAGPGAACC